MNKDHKFDKIEESVTGGELYMIVVKTPQVIRENVEVVEIDFKADHGLDGQPIRAADAAIKYEIGDDTLSNWASRGIVTVLERGPKLLMLDEATVARAVAIFKAAKEQTGSYVRAGYILKRAVENQSDENQ